MALPGLLAAALAGLALVAALAMAAAPVVVTGSATSVDPDSATLNGTVNPEGEELTQCFFEYGKTTAYGETAACAQSNAAIGDGTSPVPVHADLTGLDKASVYHFRLVAVNPSGTVNGSDQTFQTLGPVIAATWSEDVVFIDATLRAEINPGNKATTYHFEYGTSEAYGSQTPELSVGSDDTVHKVTRFLSGLQPGTTYHYRVVATNADTVSEGPDHTFTTYERLVPKTDCPNQAFRVGPSANLPDCRAYEMVSPVDKNGGEIVSGQAGGAGGGIRAAYDQASVDGEKITYTSATAFGDSVSNRNANQYLSTRGPSGWSTHAITAPLVEPTVEALGWFDTTFKDFTPDLSQAWIRDHNAIPLAPGAHPGFANLYRRDNATETYHDPVITSAPLLYEENGTGYDTLFANGVENDPMFYRGRSEDGSHMIFQVRAQLTPDANPGFNYQIYDSTAAGLELVSILPNGSATTGGSWVGAWPQFGATLPWNGRRNPVDRAVSEDGSRIFWTDRGASLNPGAGAVYVRIDGERTVAVSASGGSDPAEFWTASTDGAKAIFRVPYGPSQSFLGDVYEFDVDTEEATLIAEDSRGVVGASEDLSHLYFVSEEVLAAGAEAGEPNLYLRRNGAVSFIAALAPADAPPVVENHYLSVTSQSPRNLGARTSADGEHVAFVSRRSLTGYDNADSVTGQANMEVYLYDAGEDELSCVSCNPSGARSAGAPLQSPYTLGSPVSKNPSHPRAAGWIPPWEQEHHAARVLSEDGSRVYFNSFAALVPQDTNGVQDVYQWEAPGTGTCELDSPEYSAHNGGCVSLISTGKSPRFSEFVDATPSGSDVFIRTASSIDSRDPDLMDIYNTREEGGYPPPPPPPPPCVGDACQSVPPPPVDPTPASASFRGVGNPRALRDCGAAARRAARLSRQAKRLRRGAARRSSARGRKQLQRRSTRLAKRAKQLSRNAKRCRQANRRVTR